MDLLERSKELSAKVVSLAGLRQRAKFAELIEKRANTLDSLSENLDHLTCAAQFLSRQGIPVAELDRKLIGVLQTRTADLQSRFDVDRAVMQEPFPGQDFRFCFEQPLRKCAESSKVALSSAWAHWGNGLLPKLDGEVLTILAAIPALKAAVAHIGTLQSRASALIATLPESDNTVEILTRLAHEISSAWQGLAGDEIDPQVLMFLRAAGGQDGAAYELLTPEVLRWLAEHGLAKSLRIHMG